MPIQQLQFKPSHGLEMELEFFAKPAYIEKIYGEIQTPTDVSRWIESNADFVDLKFLCELLQRGRVLDVGVGPGLSTAYLAKKGFEMACLEPSMSSCRYMEDFFKRLDVLCDIHCGTAETMDQIKEKFDIVVFWSSLHHCDDPVLALKNAFKLLNIGGRIVLFEPVLRFFRPKSWFYRMMIEHPEKVGHYGGNEHIYRTHEYLNYLTQAGFHILPLTPSQKYTLAPTHAQWDNNTRWYFKKIYYRTMKKMGSHRNILSQLLMKLSLLTPLIIAEKKPSSFRL